MPLLPIDTFKAHGEVRVSLVPGFTLSQVTGPWNRELVKEWMAAFRTLEAELAELGPHGGITEISGSSLATVDALALMRAAVVHSVARNQLKVCAVVATPQVVGQPLIPVMFAPVFEGLTPFKAFTTMEEAQAWCRQTIANSC